MVIVIVISCLVNNHYVIKCKESKLCYIKVLLHNLTSDYVHNPMCITCGPCSYSKLLKLDM